MNLRFLIYIYIHIYTHTYARVYVSPLVLLTKRIWEHDVNGYIVFMEKNILVVRKYTLKCSRMMEH